MQIAQTERRLSEQCVVFGDARVSLQTFERYGPVPLPGEIQTQNGRLLRHEIGFGKRAQCRWNVCGALSAAGDVRSNRFERGERALQATPPVIGRCGRTKPGLAIIMLTLALGASAGKTRKDEGAVVVSVGLAMELVFWFLAVAVALRCNSGRGWKMIWPLLGAVLFPEIYLVQHVVRRSLLDRPMYCQHDVSSALAMK